jgi:transposase
MAKEKWYVYVCPTCKQKHSKFGTPKKKSDIKIDPGVEALAIVIKAELAFYNTQVDKRFRLTIKELVKQLEYKLKEKPKE